MKKKDLRKLYLEKRNNIDIDDLSEKVSFNVNELENIYNFNYYHLFLSIENKNELYTKYILHELKKRNKTIIIPKSDFSNNTMRSYIYDKDTIIENSKYGIPEPVKGNIFNDKDIEVIFIPLLAFDKKGYRVGYGKGFYDRFLENCNPNILKIGLSFFEAEKNISDINEFDKTLDFCITPNKVYKFQ